VQDRGGNKSDPTSRAVQLLPLNRCGY
jgi:hypothetical protein